VHQSVKVCAVGDTRVYTVRSYTYFRWTCDISGL